jgi:hypothetical protein
LVSEVDHNAERALCDPIRERLDERHQGRGRAVADHVLEPRAQPRVVVDHRHDARQLGRDAG